MSEDDIESLKRELSELGLEAELDDVKMAAFAAGKLRMSSQELMELRDECAARMTRLFEMKALLETAMRK